MVDNAAIEAVSRHLSGELDRGAKVVVGADDAKENLLLEKAFLEAVGYRFAGVTSCEECVSLVSRVKPHLILLDIQMPGGDGFETCRRIRAVPDRERVPIAFVTACKTEADVRAGLAAGGNDFIIKPFDRNRFVDRVNNWVARSTATALERPGYGVVDAAKGLSAG